MRALLAAALLAAATLAHAATELVIATVDNGPMIEMQRLARHFEQANPDIRLKWVTLDEGTLRKRVSEDIAQRGGAFDIMTIGLYETPIWGRRGWLRPLDPQAAYDAADLVPFIREGLSIDGRLYAAPFYGESSMLMFRRDLLAAAGLDMPNRPSWEHVRRVAERLHDPARGVYGICLRGRPGWGDNMALVTTMVNSFGGQWFDMAWQPRLDTEPWRRAIALYVELLRRFGPPQPESLSFNELQALFGAGRCALWLDATIGAAVITDPSRSSVARHVGFAQAPSGVTARGANWLWAWSLAIPAGTRHPEAARRFVLWATSKDYIALVAREAGWARVPTGTRQSTYANLDFLATARAAAAELQALHSADLKLPTLPPSPYTGIQFVAIPEFPAIGDAVGTLVAEALAGRRRLDAALAVAQQATQRAMTGRNANTSKTR
ncbi:sugar ABC transporter substrate-binding protein [Aquincola sp. S2]|uniref:Sugar ABC transporter substrate-binding protein n=1 Tax=Pseudaquabacterium terrae TaxID=2732868 RepID=A0ABX2ENV2_9BURK|nr:sugar ABC transporter substrate-binding protein [Aquabacterium terrae]NRF70244.1 sugar ABC transporter substrate-binding protein [Aquabacterium terrae]